MPCPFFGSDMSLWYELKDEISNKWCFLFNKLLNPFTTFRYH